MNQTGTHFDVKLRLSEINRRSIELCASSFELAKLAAQLNDLRKVSRRKASANLSLEHQDPACRQLPRSKLAPLGYDDEQDARPSRSLVLPKRRRRQSRALA
jgi:hypothetical protein